MMTKEEILEEINNMTEDELNDFAFFALKFMDKKCDQYEKIVYCMAEHIYKISDKYTDVKEVVDYFIEKVSNENVDFNREELFNEIGN